MKSKFFLTAGFVLSLLCAACSDDSSSITASDTGKDDGEIADKTIPENPKVETEDGATFETQGREYSENGFEGFESEDGVTYYVESSVSGMYKGEVMVDAAIDEAYDKMGATTILPGDYDYIPEGHSVYGS